jgi:hypothetical protein
LQANGICSENLLFHIHLEKDPLFLRQVWDENRLLAHVSNKKNGNSGQIKKGYIPWNKGMKLKEII